MKIFTVADHFPKLCRPRKPHRCRLCWELIPKGEPCCRWSTVERGDGYKTSHTHPECYQATLDGKWDEGDWECCMPGDLERPSACDTAPGITGDTGGSPDQQLS